MSQYVSVSIGWISNDNTLDIWLCGMQCFWLDNEDVFIFLKQILSLHAWLSWKPSQKYNHVAILEHGFSVITVVYLD